MKGTLSFLGQRAVILHRPGEISTAMDAPTISTTTKPQIAATAASRPRRGAAFLPAGGGCGTTGSLSMSITRFRS